MPEQQNRAVVLDSGNGTQAQGELQITLFSPQDRMRRALKVLGICWALAVVTLFIPIAHFFLVPGFLIAGPVSAYKLYNVTEQPEKIVTTCPHCQQQVEVEMEASEALPVWKYCPECNGALRVEDGSATAQ